jgi:transcriptional regulator with XRE-family HTH domain
MSSVSQLAHLQRSAMASVAMVMKLAPLSGAMAGLGSRLKLARLWKGRNQRQFAEDIGASAPQYNHWERDKHEPTLEFMIRLKQVHKVPLDWIYASDYEKLPPSFTQFIVTYGADPKAPKIARDIREEWGRATGFAPGAIPTSEIADAIAKQHPPRRDPPKPARRTLHEDKPETPN